MTLDNAVRSVLATMRAEGRRETTVREVRASLPRGLKCPHHNGAPCSIGVLGAVERVRTRGGVADVDGGQR